MVLSLNLLFYIFHFICFFFLKTFCPRLSLYSFSFCIVLFFHCLCFYSFCILFPFPLSMYCFFFHCLCIVFLLYCFFHCLCILLLLYFVSFFSLAIYAVSTRPLRSNFISCSFLQLLHHAACSPKNKNKKEEKVNRIFNTFCHSLFD